jgi:2',3'-cyclic-nucleotide 2'-phosphodiesterase (5'-nucleotidase family)
MFTFACQKNNYMRKIAFGLLFLVAVAAFGQKREVHILAANDMHSAVDAMPKVAAIADSLRSLYPSLLIFSAGDNRTGNPISDMYHPSAYPMVALMNQVGFHASALGNHEFDMNSLPELIGLSNFRYICANIIADDLTGIRTVPYQVFDVEGLKIGVIGITQYGQHGRPDTHPDNLHGLRFEVPEEAVSRYEWLSRECDVTILLSHEGFRGDTAMAMTHPWLDLIIGGHSHTQLKDNEVHNGVLITQNRNKLYKVTHITLTVDSGRVVGKQSEYIDVRQFAGTNRVVADMVQTFNNNPDFKRVLAHSVAPFANIYELGSMVCDALQAETGADVAIQNYHGVRLESHPGGDITVHDVLAIDPFANAAYELTVTGKELFTLIEKYSRMDIYHFPHLAGLRAELTLDKEDTTVIRKIKLLDADGRKLDMKRTYRVVTNSYVAAAIRAYGFTEVTRLNVETAALIMNYLEKRGTVNYQGVNRVEMKK